MFTNAVCTEPIENANSYVGFKHIKSLRLREVAHAAFLNIHMHTPMYACDDSVLHHFQTIRPSERFTNNVPPSVFRV